jgi:hypothetical protein
MENEHEHLSMLMLRLSQRHDIRNVSLSQLEALAKDIARECITLIPWSQGAYDAIMAIEARFDLIEE